MDRESILRLGEAYNQIEENIAQRQAERYKKALEKIVKDLPQGIMQGGANIESGLTGNDAATKERERQRRLNDPKLRAVDRATGQQGVDPFGKQSQMTQDQESGRTNIPRTDAQGKRIYTDADRPQGYHTIKKDGKDIRRYWDSKNKSWRVDPDGQFQMGVEKPNDPAAREIRRDSAPGPKVFNMSTDNPLDTLKDQGSKMFDAIRGVGPGPQDVKGLDDPLGLGDATGLKPQGSGTKDTNAQSTSSGMTPAELKAAQDKVNQQRADGKMGGLPSDYKETELEAGRNAEASRPGAGLPVSGGGNQAPGERRGPGPKETGSGNLTPMQQWAKNFPKLAAKVKPGQAGYDEIQRMDQPSSTPATQSQNTSKLGDTKTRTQQAFSNQNQGLNKVSQPIARSMSRVNDASSKMNNVKQSNSKLAFRGLPESYSPDDIVMDFLMEGLNHDEQSARALMPHISPEFRAYIEENWASDWAKKAGSFINNAGRAIKRGTEGKKVDKDSNPVHRTLNSITRGTGDTLKSFGSGLTQKGGDKDSAVKDQKDRDEKKDEPKKDEPKNDGPGRTPPSVRRVPEKSAPKTTGSDDKVGGRLGSALKWASDPKNKDAWMKEALDAMADGLTEGRGLSGDKDDYQKMRDRNANAGHTPGNTYATAQRRMRSDLLRGKKKERGEKKGGKPAWMSDEQWLAHTKGQLAFKRPDSVAGKRQRDNDAMEKAERGGTKNNRGS